MKLVIVNGSPRKGWNTDLLLKKAEEGAKAVGAEVTYVNLYDLDFKGCRSCLACKRVGGKSLGHCAYPDALKSVLDAIDQSDALILGSPIYYGDISAEARCFFERLLFQYTNFDGGAFYLTHPIKAACVYTMNGTADYMQPGFQEIPGNVLLVFQLCRDSRGGRTHVETVVRLTLRDDK
jgi:multimeric flavodoxin WrbA